MRDLHHVSARDPGLRAADLSWAVGGPPDRLLDSTRPARWRYGAWHSSALHGQRHQGEYRWTTLQQHGARRMLRGAGLPSAPSSEHSLPVSRVALSTRPPNCGGPARGGATRWGILRANCLERGSARSTARPCRDAGVRDRAECQRRGSRDRDGSAMSGFTRVTNHVSTSVMRFKNFRWCSSTCA